jgi:hypothetical protein
MVAHRDEPAISVMEDHGRDEWNPAFNDAGRALAALLESTERVDPPAWLRRLDGPSGAASGWASIAANPTPFLELGVCSKGWFGSSIDSLIAVEKRVSIAGRSLIHGDIRGDNICYTKAGALLVDWGNACVGNANIDRASAVAAIRLRTGKTPDAACDDPFAWAAWQAGRHAKMNTTPRPAHIRADSVLRQPATDYLRHVLE